MHHSKKTKKCSRKVSIQLVQKLNSRQHVRSRIVWAKSHFTCFMSTWPCLHVTTMHILCHGGIQRDRYHTKRTQLPLFFVIKSNRSIGTVTQLYSYDFVFRYLQGKTGPCSGNNTPQKLQSHRCRNVEQLLHSNLVMTVLPSQNAPPKLNIAPKNACLEDDLFVSGWSLFK